MQDIIIGAVAILVWLYWGWWEIHQGAVGQRTIMAVCVIVFGAILIAAYSHMAINIVLEWNTSA